MQNMICTYIARHVTMPAKKNKQKNDKLHNLFFLLFEHAIHCLTTGNEHYLWKKIFGKTFMSNAMKNVLQENNANNGYSPFSKTCFLKRTVGEMFTNIILMVKCGGWYMVALVCACQWGMQ